MGAGVGRGQSVRWGPRPAGILPPIARDLLSAGPGSHADLIPAAAVPPAVVDATLLGLHAAGLRWATACRVETKTGIRPDSPKMAWSPC